jgi:hypothetical protein
MSQKYQSKEQESLSEKDYLSTLDIISQFNQCETRLDVNSTLGSAVMPYLKAQACTYFFSDLDILNSKFRAIESINISESDAEANLEILPYDPLIPIYLKSHRSIFSIPTDITIQKYRQEMEKFFVDHPEKPSDRYSFLLEKLNSGIVSGEGPHDTKIVLSLLRVDTNTKPFTLRDIRKMELLRPHLLNTIKTLALREELAQYQSLVEVLKGSTTAIALVHFDMMVLYSNPTFAHLFSLEDGQRLPNILGDLIEKQANKYSNPVIHEDSMSDLPFYTTDQGVFRLSLDKVEGRGVDADECWIIRLKPAIEPYTKMNYFMQVKGVSRQMNVDQSCKFLRDTYLPEWVFL